MKIGVIGAGNWGKNIVRTLYGLNGLAAVAETSTDIRAGLETEYPSLQVYPDYQSLLGTDIPAVAIATPVITHFEVAKAALLAGKDVFVEKPLTLASAEAQDLVRLAEKKQRILMVGHLLLYQPAVQWVKSYIASGALGKLHSLHQERLNLGRARKVENALWSLGVHDVAVLLHLVGQAPEGLEVSGQCVLQPGIEDDVYLHLNFPGGVQAHLHNSWLWPEKHRRLTVVGSEGMLVYDEADQTVTLHRKGINPDLSNRDGGAEIAFRGDGEPLALELKHFLDCVAGRLTPLSDGRSGLAVVRVLEEATKGLNSPPGPLSLDKERGWPIGRG
ncbi:MAG: Gfo/Idh/MocA family protein [Bacteroidota bacterium]